MSALASQIRPLTALFGAGWQSARQDKITRIALATVYVGLIVVLSGLYRMTPFETLENAEHLTFASVVWYMTITELVAIAVWTQYREVREEVLSHQIAGRFVLPLSYHRIKAGEWLGRTSRSMIEFSLLGTLVAWLLTGGFSPGLASLPLLAVSLFLSVIIFNNIHMMIGLTEVWGAHSRPAFLIMQKLLFLLGGLLIPLDIYPQWLQKIAWATPFPAILYGPGSFAFGKSGSEVIGLLSLQVFWAFATLGAASLVYLAARNKIGRDGD